MSANAFYTSLRLRNVYVSDVFFVEAVFAKNFLKQFKQELNRSSFNHFCDSYLNCRQVPRTRLLETDFFIIKKSVSSYPACQSVIIRRKTEYDIVFF